MNVRMSDLSRRRILRGAGVALAAGAVAGCAGGGGGDADSIDGYLSGANNYDGTVVDMTGESEVTVAVGAGNGLAFDPAAVRVDAGTTVAWEWTGRGGRHNVVSGEESASEFESNLAREAGTTFRRTFESGPQLYLCNPHRAQGMYGAVAIAE